MINNIQEQIIHYEAHDLEELDLIATIIGQESATSLHKAGILNISDLKNRNFKELTQLKGIGKNKAIQLLALYELCNRKKPEKIDQISGPNDIYKVCKDMQNFDREVLRLICLNTKNHIIAIKDLFKGGVSTSIVDMRVLLREALRVGSTAIIIVHNHPSGDPTPSREDMNITQKLDTACKYMDLRLLDHLVIGKDDYVSFSEKGAI